MSHSCESFVAPFIIEDFYCHSHTEQSPLDMETLEHGIYALEMFNEDREEDIEQDKIEFTDKIVIFKETGWLSYKDDTFCAADGNIFAYVWRKGDYILQVANTSQYNNVGEVELSAIAKDRASLKEFAKDFNIDLTKHPIRTNRAFQRWG